MREVPLEDSREAVDFANRLLAGQVDAMILLTGVGTQQFVNQVERHVGRERLLDALSDIPTIVRGPKPTATLKKLGITPTHRAPEPNTWREVLGLLDQAMPVANMRVGLQEYGVTNPSLIAGLEARGAVVDRVRVYQWSLPEDTAPLKKNIERLLSGSVDLVIFTSAQQVENLLSVAAEQEQEGPLREALDEVVIASIGPTTSERLRQQDLSVDMEASHPTMGRLVQEAVEQGHALIERKQRLPRRSVMRTTVSTPNETAATMSQADSSTPINDPWADSPFMRACRRQPVDYTPVWLMRQAGRYMPEYREVRAKQSFLDLCKNPALCSEVMCTAVDFLGVDAAIIFSDLLPILEPMGMDLEFQPGDGPVIHNPLRGAGDVDRLIDLESVDSLHYVVETVRQTRKDLPSHLPLIGFAGAPFTLASYAIEGGGSRTYLHTKTLMYRDPGAWKTLMERFSRAIALYLNAQIEAGAQVVQLFDSWVGCLGPGDYNQYVAPYVTQLIAAITPGVPVIHFGTGNPELLPHMARAGGDVVGVDWRIDLADAWQRIGHDRAVQGNLEPLVLLAERETIKRRAQEVLTQAANRPGHIFNLGHGVLQQTPPDNARALVDMVHELSAR